MPELCDVTFLVGDTREPVCAVKAVLAARSRYLWIRHKLFQLKVVNKLFLYIEFFTTFFSTRIHNQRRKRLKRRVKASLEHLSKEVQNP